MQIVKLPNETYTFSTVANAARALVMVVREPADLTIYKEIRIRPRNSGWQVSFVTTIGSFVHFVGIKSPCGYSEAESEYRDHPTGKYRMARCEGDERLVVRGNGEDSYTDGTVFISARKCPNCTGIK